MRAISHGSTWGPRSDKKPEEVLNELGGDLKDQYFFDLTGNRSPSFPICHMFQDLAADKNSLIPETDKTLEHLTNLGESMRDKVDTHNSDDPEFNKDIPSAYTYFSQLVNHDITFTDVKKDDGVTDAALLADPQLKPWTIEKIEAKVTNKRERVLDLDCVYGTMQGGVFPPRVKDKRDLMALGRVFNTDADSFVEDGFSDLVRCPKSDDRKKDRTALIADRRNDSNVIISQLQVAFLRAHNVIVEKLGDGSFAKAQSLLRQHYQWVVFDDFLRRIVPKNIIDDVLVNPKFDAGKGVPFEFSMGAFRFGHAMIRRSYYLNNPVGRQDLSDLFTVMALSNSVTVPQTGVGFPSLPKNRIIQWNNFLTGAGGPHVNFTQMLRTQMVDPLFELFDDTNMKIAGLAVQDLKRAYMMRIPTGQALAERLVKPEDRLTMADIESVTTPEQLQILRDSGFLERTPLPFYVLAEAAAKGGGKTLGPVGGRIVAEVVIGTLKSMPGSCLHNPNWTPDPALAPNGTFSLKDLLQLADVM